MTSHLHIVAASRGVSAGVGCLCAVCGISPFNIERTASDVLGPNFSDYDCIADPGHESVCAACVSCLSGRPGDDPPPLRTMHVLSIVGEPARYPATKELSEILRTPPDQPFVLVWAASRKRHAVLRAGMSTADRMVIGADEGSVVFERQHVLLLDAVESLRPWHNSDEIESGQYQATRIASMSADRWAAAEAVVAPHRGTTLLSLVCAVARRSDPTPPTEVPVYDEIDERAAQLLRQLADASDLRRSDGVRFWSGGLFTRRLRLCASASLRDTVAGLMRHLQCAPTHTAITEMHIDLDRATAAETSQIASALRSRPELLVALAYQRMKEDRA